MKKYCKDCFWYQGGDCTHESNLDMVDGLPEWSAGICRIDSYINAFVCGKCGRYGRFWKDGRLFSKSNEGE